MQPSLSLTASYNRTIEGFRGSIAMNGFRLVASQDKHIKHFLNVTVQEPLAAIPVTRLRSNDQRGSRTGSHGILCMTRDFFVYAEGCRLLRWDNDYEIFNREQPPVTEADGHSLKLRRMGYQPVYSHFRGAERDIKCFVAAAVRL